MSLLFVLEDLMFCCWCRSCLVSTIPPLLKFRKNYVSAVRIVAYVKNFIVPLPFPPAGPP